MTYLNRKANEDTTSTNRDFVKFVSTTDMSETYGRLSLYQNLTAAAAAIDPEAERQFAGVFGNFK